MHNNAPLLINLFLAIIPAFSIFFIHTNLSFSGIFDRKYLFFVIFLFYITKSFFSRTLFSAHFHRFFPVVFLFFAYWQPLRLSDTFLCSHCCVYSSFAYRSLAGIYL